VPFQIYFSPLGKLALRNFFLFFKSRPIISGFTKPIFAIFSPYVKAFLVKLTAKLTDLNLFFQFLKGRCHGNEFWAKLAK